MAPRNTDISFFSMFINNFSLALLATDYVRGRNYVGLFYEIRLNSTHWAIDTR